MLTRTARVVINAATNYARFLVSMIVLFLLTPAIIRHIGVRDFGLWSLTFSVLGFFSLLDMGFGTGVVRYVAECRGAKDAERRNRMVSTLALVYILLALASVAGIGILSLFYRHLFGIPSDQQAKALAILWILALRAVVLALPLGLFQGVLFGEQRILLINSVQIVASLLYGLLAWTALARGAGVMTLAWINLAVMLAEYLSYVVFAYLSVPGLRIAWRLADKSLLREVTSFSMAQFVVSMAALVRLRTDPLIVKCFLPLSQVAVYAIALRIAESALLLTKQGINVLAPLVAQLKGEGDSRKIRYILVQGAGFAFAAAVVLTVAVCVFAREIILFWVGPQFAGAAPVLIVLMVSMCLVVPQMVAANVLVMTGYHKLTARAEVIGMLINLAVSVALARPLGIVGVALGTLTSTILIDLGLIVGAACRLHGVPYLSYFKQMLLAGALPGVAQLGVTLVIKTLWPPANFLELAMEATPGVLIALTLFWTFSVEPATKQKLTKRLLPCRSALPRQGQPVVEQ